MESQMLIIACSIFKTELEKLRKEGKIDIPVIYLNSMLHMYPAQLNELLDTKIEEYKNFKIILVFGDCHARMVDYENNTNITRTPGINCCEILLGTEKYRTMRKEGAFILLPEWAERWKEVFNEHMGFKTSGNATEFMKEMHTKLVFVNTEDKIKENVMKEIVDYIHLPYETISCSVAELEHSILKLIEDGR